MPGPWLVDAAEVPDPHALGLRTFDNGRLTQQGSTANMLNRIPNFDDADLGRALDAAVFMIFSNNGECMASAWRVHGERCTAGSRILVQKRIYAGFAEKFAEQARRIRVGDPLEDPGRPDDQPGPPGQSAQLHRAGPERRRHAAVRWHRPPELRARVANGAAGRQLRQAHGVCRCRQPHAHRPGRDLRPGGLPDPFRRRGRCRPSGQRHRLRPVELCPAIEIIDARIEQFDRDSKAPRKVFDTISDFAASAGIVLGGRPVRPLDVGLRWVGALLHKNGVVEETALAGDSFHADHGPLGSVAFRFVGAARPAAEKNTMHHPPRLCVDLLKSLALDHAAHAKVQRWAQACLARPVLVQALAQPQTADHHCPCPTA